MTSRKAFVFAYPELLDPKGWANGSNRGHKAKSKSGASSYSAQWKYSPSDRGLPGEPRSWATKSSQSAVVMVMPLSKGFSPSDLMESWTSWIRGTRLKTSQFLGPTALKKLSWNTIFPGNVSLGHTQQPLWGWLCMMALRTVSGRRWPTVTWSRSWTISSPSWSMEATF